MLASSTRNRNSISVCWNRAPAPPTPSSETRFGGCGGEKSTCKIQAHDHGDTSKDENPLPGFFGFEDDGGLPLPGSACHKVLAPPPACEQREAEKKSHAESCKMTNVVDERRQAHDKVQADAQEQHQPDTQLQVIMGPVQYQLPATASKKTACCAGSAHRDLHWQHRRRAHPVGTGGRNQRPLGAVGDRDTQHWHPNQV